MRSKALPAAKPAMTLERRAGDLTYECKTNARRRDGSGVRAGPMATLTDTRTGQTVGKY